MRLTNDDSSASDVRRVGARRLFAKKARGQGALPVTAACRRVRNSRMSHMAVHRRVLPPALQRRPDRRSPQPAEAGAEAVGPLRERPAARTRGGYQRGQPAGGQWRSQPHTGHRRWNGRPPAGYREFRPAAREQARYRPLDPACLERPRNFRSRREYPPQSPRGWSTGRGRRRLVQAPAAVSPHHVRESTGACHPAARYHSPKRTSRHAVPPL